MGFHSLLRHAIIALLLAVFTLAVSACGGGRRTIPVIQYAPPETSSSSFVWVHTWKSELGASAYALTEDDNGSLYLTGEAITSSSTDYDLLLLKFTSEGILLWQKAWGCDGDDTANAITHDSLGNIYVAGVTASYGPERGDVLLLKYSSAGDLVWGRTWGGLDREEAFEVAVDNNGDIILSGYTDSYGAGQGDVLLLKYSPSGELIWQKTWGGEYPEGAEALAIDNDGNAYVSGSGIMYDYGTFEAFLLKCSPTGELLWQKVWDNDDESFGSALALDEAGYVYMAGWLYKNGNVDHQHSLLIKYSTDGALQWQRTCDLNGWAKALAVAVDGNGDVYLGGETQRYKDYVRYDEALLMRYTSEGDVIWQRVSLGRLGALELDCSGRLYVAGNERLMFNPWRQEFTDNLIPEGVSRDLDFPVIDPDGSEFTPTGIESTPGGIFDFFGDRYCISLLSLDTSRW
jgi:uncharacterized delta-60 repeat protein